MLFSLVLIKTLVMTVSCSSSVDPVTKISSIIPLIFLILENTVSRFYWIMSWDIVKPNSKRLNLYLLNRMLKVHSRCSGADGER